MVNFNAFSENIIGKGSRIPQTGSREPKKICVNLLFWPFCPQIA